MMQIQQTPQFQGWLAKLRDRRGAAIIASRIIRVRNGLMGDVKSVGNGVSELRIDEGPGYRVYFTRRGGELIILLCGGNKSSQSRDIKAAQILAASL